MKVVYNQTFSSHNDHLRKCPENISIHVCVQNFLKLLRDFCVWQVIVFTLCMTLVIFMERKALPARCCLKFPQKSYFLLATITSKAPSPQLLSVVSLFTGADTEFFLTESSYNLSLFSLPLSFLLYTSRRFTKLLFLLSLFFQVDLF